MVAQQRVHVLVLQLEAVDYLGPMGRRTVPPAIDNIRVKELATVFFGLIK